jgi:hypothetical protein
VLQRRAIMTGYRGVFPLAIAAAVVALVSWWVVRVRAQSSPAGSQDVRPYQSPHKTIDVQSDLAREGDESAVRALVDAVFNFPVSYPAMPPEIETMVKERLVHAEISYRRGGAGGVPEENIINLVNTLAGRLGMPAYTYTNPRQVRYLRMVLAIAEPRFMGSGMAHPSTSSSESVDPTMSPLQAAHLAAYLANQKVINGEFQVSPAEWDETERPVPVAQEGGPKAGRFRSSPKTTEMRREFLRVGASLTSQEALDIVNQAFSLLGIDQRGDTKP